MILVLPVEHVSMNALLRQSLKVIFMQLTLMYAPTAVLVQKYVPQNQFTRNRIPEYLIEKVEQLLSGFFCGLLKR